MQRLRLSTAGESHGPAELCVLEGIPAGLEVTAGEIDRELARRQRGYGRGARMTIERDRVSILGGVRLGVTLGSPIALLVENKDHPSWRTAMQPEPGPRPEHGRVTVPRPGHADLAGLAKFGHEDVRDVLERASARETVSRVAAGAVAKLLLHRLGVTVRGRVVQVGNVSAPEMDLANPKAIDWAAVEESAFGCDDPETGERMQQAVDDARTVGESLGGVFEVWAWDVCPGLGSYSRAGDRLDGRLMGALGSIPAVKGVEVGLGFASAGLQGSEVHDPILLELGVADQKWVTRVTNRAGGLEGGVTNGMPLVLRAAMKPIPTLSRPLPSVDLATMEPTMAHRERSDVEAVAAARVVGEAVVALELADAALDKFGGDSLREFLASFDQYVSLLEARGLWRR